MSQTWTPAGDAAYRQLLMQRQAAPSPVVEEAGYEALDAVAAEPTSQSGLRIPLPQVVRRLLTDSMVSTAAHSEQYEDQTTPTNVLTDVVDTHPITVAIEKEALRKSTVNSVTNMSMGRGRRRPNDLPHFPVPRVTIQETQRYTFAIILRNTKQVARYYKSRLKGTTDPVARAHLSPPDMSAHVAALQQKCLRRLVQSGLGVILLDNDIYIEEKDTKHAQTDNICILVDPYKSKGLLHLEFMREKDEFAIAQGNATSRLGEARLPITGSKDICFSPALELQLTHNIIRNAFRDYDQDAATIDRQCYPTVDDVIHAVFPLHDKKQMYRKRTFQFKWGRTITGNSERWAIEELRLHFGERIAFLFAFMHIYTKALVPIVVIGTVFYISCRYFFEYSWSAYMIGLAIFGFGIATIWGPVLLHVWGRETRLLVEKWNLGGYKQTVYESNEENPGYQYTWEQNVLTQQWEKTPKRGKLEVLRTTMGLFVVVSCILQCAMLLPFIQWYVYAKQLPMCSECEANLKGVELADRPFASCTAFFSCFNSETSTIGSDRWVYILAQGIALGLVIDVVFFEFFNWLSDKFVEWENCEKKSEHEARLIHRSFVFVWSNWFFWFLFLAFVYLPFGETINKAFLENVLHLWSWPWTPGLLTIDTLFVTPLVVTQFLNMTLETLVPYLMKKFRGKPFSMRKWFSTWTCSLRRDKRKHMARATANKSARKLAADVSAVTRFFVPVLERSDDDNQHTAYEIFAESTLPVFDPKFDYLDAAIQFSYVVMFTVVWPLLPIPAFLNNIFEVRGDAFRLLFCHRRPMPRRDASIGEWATALQYANIIGITVVAIFIVMYHSEAFYGACDYQFATAVMVPILSLNSTEARNATSCSDFLANKQRIILHQVFAFIVLEHVGFIVRYLVTQGDKTPRSIGNPSYVRLKQLRELASKRSAVVEQFEYMKQLRVVFDKHDSDGIDHLYEDELVSFLAEWVGADRSKLAPYGSILFRYMDKNRLGKVPFSTCCLMLRHAEYDRFFSVLLGTCDSLDNFRNDRMRLSIADEGLGAHARHLSRYQSLSSHTPRHSDSDDSFVSLRLRHGYRSDEEDEEDRKV
ncbi:transmembrane protein [Achlya hypogyna]|uniref:Transmembrane protein n=1 Tax=Achlya hypogyna TaxID=1202772 RepID=A0A1V9YND5_ACHHY|nr:transmembrane protein [Achlya hypogyna]